MTRCDLRRLAIPHTIVAFVAAIGLLAASTAAADAPARVSANPGLGPAASQSFSCTQEDYCDYIYDNGTGLCFKASPFGGTGDIPNWGKYGCRNVDGSFYNNSPFTIRLYYGPNYGDPHACIKPFTKITDLFNYDFNSGTGSSRHLVVGNDVASSTMSLTACTNPI